MYLIFYLMVVIIYTTAALPGPWKKQCFWTTNKAGFLFWSICRKHTESVSVLSHIDLTMISSQKSPKLQTRNDAMWCNVPTSKEEKLLKGLWCNINSAAKIKVW
jgi:hypothetical protein